MARFYSNENFPFKTVAALRNLGHDVLTTQDAGKAVFGIPDDEVLSFAADQHRILLTINRKDFIRLHKRGVQHSGIVVCTVNPDFQDLAYRIHQSVEQQPKLENELIRVYKGL